MWSLGCIVYELVTHKVLFNNHSELKNLVKAMAINRTSDLNCFKNIRATHYLRDNFLVISEHNFDEDTIQVILPNMKMNFINELIENCREPLLVDFIKKCLLLDPSQRITPELAMKHPFLRKKF